MSERRAGELRRNDFFLSRVYGKYLAASVLSMLATSVSGMIDTVLSGQFLGEDGLAAMSLAGSVGLVYFTVGAVIGMGGSIAGNLAIGRADYKRYRELFTLTVLAMAAASLVMTALGLAFLDELVAALGGEGRVGEYTRDYLYWYILGGACTLFIYVPINFCKMDGLPRAASFLFILSSGLNVAFTWLFMSPACGLGIAGAAVGTQLSMGISVLIGALILAKRAKNTRFISLRGVKIWRSLGEILLSGSPNGCNNLFNALKLMLINSLILGLGQQAYLASFSLIKSVSDLVTGVVNGVAGALMPIVGVYFGERDWGSIHGVCRRAARTGGIITAAFALGAALLSGALCALFNITEPAAAEAARRGLACLAASFVFGFANLMCVGYFNTVRRPMLSNLILGLRTLVCLAPCALLLSRALGIDGVWLALVAADALTSLVLLAAVCAIRRGNRGLDALLLDRALLPEREISFSVENTVDAVVSASEKISGFCEDAGLDARQSMRVSLALEELLSVILQYCLHGGRRSYVDIRIFVAEGDAYLRFRWAGRIFDPLRWYEDNRSDPEMAESTLGVKLIAGQAKDISFRETFGANNLLVRF